MFGRLGPLELIIILIVALIILGPSKLPEVGRSLGKGIKAFKKETSNLMDDDEDEKKKELPKKEEEKDKDE